jgi:O-antigen/teichoic acid export membrane protein
LIGFLKKIYFSLWILVFSGAVFLYFFPNLILGYFIDNPSEGSNYLKYLGFLIFIVSLNMPFNQSLLALKKDWLVLRIVFLSSIISLLLNFLIVPKYGINGSILTMFVTETIVTCSFIYCFLKTDLIKIQK